MAANRRESSIVIMDLTKPHLLVAESAAMASLMALLFGAFNLAKGT